ncbi:MAG: patatin-like phospholipase family protein [Clostridia bacterium]|nr:patatin-like phospholipase family protein [Clostridia bacterium]
MQHERKRLRIGIAFSGGISKCAYQLGFTKALLRYVDRSEITAISGSSMGFFSAYALSANKIDRLEWIYRKIDVEKPRDLVYQIAVKGMLVKLIDYYVGPEDVLEIPMCFPVCYFPILSTRYYWIKDEYNPAWKKYIQGATNFPGLYLKPLFKHGRYMLDGGASDNIPIYPLINYPKLYKEEPLDLIIALHFDARYDNRRYFNDSVPILDLDVTIANDFRKDHFNFSAEYANEMLERGEEYGEQICKKLFTGDCSREGLKKKIGDIFLEEHDRREQNSSVDALFSMINILGRTFRSKSSDCFKKLY